MHGNFTLAVFLLKFQSVSFALCVFSISFVFATFCTLDSRYALVAGQNECPNTHRNSPFNHRFAQVAVGISCFANLFPPLPFFLDLQFQTQICPCSWPQWKSQAVPKSAPGHPKSSQGPLWPPRAASRAPKMILRCPLNGTTSSQDRSKTVQDCPQPAPRPPKRSRPCVGVAAR